MVRMAWLALLLPAAMCDNNDPNRGRTDLTTPTNPDTQILNGTLDCGANFDIPTAGVPGLPECVVEEIGCGDTVYGNNAGGTEFYDWYLWNEGMALGQLPIGDPTVLDGPERIYAITGHPPNSDVEVTLTSCVQLWGSYRLHTDLNDNWCADVGNTNTLGHFGGEWQDRSIILSNRTSIDYDWEIIVDSWEGQTGNYALSVKCISGG